jgi:flagellar protein FlgJ
MSIDNSVITIGRYNKVDISQTQNLKKLKADCDAFESELLKHFLKDALKEDNSLYPKSAGENIYKSMETEQYAKSLSGDFGYSKLLFNYLQEKQHHLS